MPEVLQSPPEEKQGKYSEERFQTARSTLFVDRFMTHFIKVGGIGIIAAVFGIFIFIFAQILPLFRGAHVEELRTVSLEKGDYGILGADEWGEKPFLVDSTGRIYFADAETGVVSQAFDPAGLQQTISSFSYNARRHEVIYGTADGHAIIASINYSPVYEDGGRRIEGEVEAGEPVPVGEPGFPVTDISFGGSEDRTIIAVVQNINGNPETSVVTLERESSLFSQGELEVTDARKITGLLPGKIRKILVNSSGDAIVAATEQGEVLYLLDHGDEIEPRQTFKPFRDLADPRIDSINYLLGDVSLVMTSPGGVNRIFSLYIPRGESKRVFGHTKTFKPVPVPVEFYNASLRNKAFLLGGGNFVSLRYATTEKIRWEKELPFQVELAALGPKYDRIFMVDAGNRLHIYELEDEHPEAGLKAFFGKVWYEGYNEPSFEWQSTGGSDEFEPKLSLVPLIIGTLKGTFYALIFALPIAVLAAIYTSQFAHPGFRSTIKPAMEIMASLPSVVLGFLAALWLAPVIETRVPSLLLILILLPAVSLLAGALWSRLPTRYRNIIPPGYEWLALLPLVILTCWAGWVLGPVLERYLFVVYDPQTGLRIADFRLWWPQVTGLPFEQRNSLVVGFIMGFAVIPIIFTISEDSLSNVPRTLTSASLALGATRWQTALRVVVPTAFPGIFSALMIGLGRAVGETMIVVMATGNTPVMDFNIFSGMRTLSANIAVELPEAPYLGTLYRTLFLGAMVLFLMTFVMNTAAEIIRQKLREKYRTV